MEILSLGEKIRNKRKELNMTLKDLAGDRVTAGQLSFVELGKSNPSPELLNYIAKRLGVSTDFLLESEESQARRICQFNIRLSQAYIYDNNDEDACELLKQCRDIASKYNLTHLLGIIEFNNGIIELKSGNYSKAMEHFLMSNKLYLECHEYGSALESYILMGETSYKSGSPSLALNYYKQAEKLGRDKGLYSDKLKARIDFGVCICSVKLGYDQDTNEYLSHVDEYLTCIDDKYEYAHSLMKISLAYKENRNYDKALYYSNAAVDLFKEIEDEEYLVRMYMQIGIIYSDKGDIQKSSYYLQKCCDKGEILSGSDMAIVYLKLANNNTREGKLKDASSLIRCSLDIAVKNRDINCQIECYSSLSKVYYMQNDKNKYEDLLKCKLRLLESMDIPEKAIEGYIELGNYYNSIGDKAQASEYMEKCYDKFCNKKQAAAN